ncbi:hypothetical protein HBI56_216340 [Parastagonospora nodorum]|uniref:Uncharacterized protein n=2 Tax=Phaeosphaeria nodorum (strain SN15 / ATCC MYA-4574 / FGSC 10173) TaxID=321614 RepID=A0A7U2F453_PHANO|nr:hypothetical protein SNOG_01170 [Parastagonospora nodorum SN15]KAH3908519.1 hypothetical protein HBH56_176130 [Parastagonospora nodorum]EAT90819.1 hypothetical protein SNOG_01170 [Parastagonospora nodorum SN15]KAH3926308.1 hypothetical protein HBH54_167040 [Parastagonospora nodorum]KAH3939142.1 hypothetical protein HBH53_239890 [Parastagonospora nodorum]KAH3965528.1 hypothetical protein HBH52_203680 [Parastagonospora nodorum]
MSSQPTTFRFRDLPREIRDKIYRELLCNFKPRPEEGFMSAEETFEYTQANNGNEAAILRTNKDVYREAYDVMVKTNRFVRLTSARGLPIILLLQSIRVPIVTSDKAKVEQFKGYVLALRIGSTVPPNTPQDDLEISQPCSVMILHRDMGWLCQALSDGDAHRKGFSLVVQISIDVAPALIEPLPIGHVTFLQDFFSETTQATLLAPFRTLLRGLQNIKVQGHVNEDLALAVQDEIKQDRWSDPEKVLADLVAAKENGSSLFKQQNGGDAYLAWADAAVDIDKILASGAWPALVRRGGKHFVSQLAELYFLLRLNLAFIQIANIQENPGMAFYAAIIAEESLNSAARSTKKSHWMEGYKYRPSIQHLAKLRYRFAVLIRLKREPGTADRALMYIDAALQLQPGDASIMKERDSILVWLQSGG